MSGKFSVGTIAEDFKKIGLIPQDIVESAPVEPVPPVKAEPAASTTSPAEVTEGVKLLRKKRPTGKLRMQRRKQKVLRRRNKGKLKLKAKRFRRSARGKRFLRKYKMAMSRFHGHAPKGKRVSLKMGLDRVSSMLEEVQEIVSAIDADAKQETVKSFANLALISNQLAESFAYACENFELEGEDEDEGVIDLCGGAEHFEALADSAANLAEALQASMQEGTEFEGTSEEVAETFSVMLADVLEGLEAFAALSEDEEGDEKETAETAEESEEAAEEADETAEDAETAEEADEGAEEADEGAEEADEGAEEADEADEGAEDKVPLRTRTVKDVGPLAGEDKEEEEEDDAEEETSDVRPTK